MLNKETAILIKQKLTACDMTQIELATKFKVQRVYLNAIINGKICNERIESELIKWLNEVQNG